MSAPARIVVMYDVTSNRERREVEQVLKGFGVRVQYSVFECRLTEAARRVLEGKLAGLGLRTAHIRIYRVPANTRVIELGRSRAGLVDRGVAFIV